MEINSDTKKVTCPTCKGTGLDSKHTWPDGSNAHCETCDGYGEKSSGDMANLGEMAQQEIANLVRAYSVSDILDCMAHEMREMADGELSELAEADRSEAQDMRDSAQIVAHAAAHIKS